MTFYFVSMSRFTSDEDQSLHGPKCSQDQDSSLENSKSAYNRPMMLNTKRGNLLVASETVGME